MNLPIRATARIRSLLRIGCTFAESNFLVYAEFAQLEKNASMPATGGYGKILVCIFCNLASVLRVFMLLMIDNYDSFTWNLVQYFAELGHDTLVRRNDEINLDDIIALNPSRLVISPGPCSPNEAGISLAAIRHFAGKIPLLGVCLGHQAIAQAFGGQIVRAKQVVHGKNSWIRHNHQSVFRGLKDPLSVTRYHSLVVEMASLPAEFMVTAWTEHEDGRINEIMGIAHRELPIHGVQFHPEAILTEQGHQLLANFLQIPASRAAVD